MGPRPFSRGNAYRGEHNQSDVPCFNGATTFQPWKPRSRTGTRRKLHSFNGATTFQPWKPIEPEDVVIQTDASMGPRPFSRGNTRRWPGRRRRRNASMGPRPFSRGNRSRSGVADCFMPRFNGATTFQPWKRAVRDRPLGVLSSASMGPRPFSRGNDSGGRQRPRGRSASMGPRPFSRGNPVLRRCGVPSTAASMGPRPFSRGNIQLEPGQRRPLPLQWGHDLSAVETSRPFLKASISSPLQWGHDLSAVETTSASRCTASSRSLQWGHDLSAVETRLSRRQGHSPRRFNGATTFQPWKPYSQLSFLTLAQ